jgi:hypothetical protein
MLRIAISAEAFKAIALTLPFGSVGYEAKPSGDGEVFLWLEKHAVVQLDLMRGAGESYSDVILRLADIEAAKRGSRTSQ